MKGNCQPGDDGLCTQCGVALPPNVRRMCSACDVGRVANVNAERRSGATARPRSARKSRGLGDWTERQFKKVGITQDRYKEAKEKFGLSPTCSCPERIAWLNRVSDWWRDESPS